MRAIVITAASSGIGRAAAKEFVEHGYRVFGGVRKKEDADRLKAESGPSFTSLLFDVTGVWAVAGAAGEQEKSVGSAGLAGLVNNAGVNAGVALAGPLMHQPSGEMRRHFEVNVFGLISVIRAFLPGLGAEADPVWLRPKEKVSET